jgi:hypothetical protein
MPSINKKTCPTCGQTVNEQKITFASYQAYTIKKIHQWCKGVGRHEFQKKEIKHLINDVESANLAYLKWFGLLYRPEGAPHGTWGINLTRVEDFLAGRHPVYTVIWKNPLTGQLSFEDQRYIHEIPHLKTFLDENDNYIAEYREPQTKLF